MEKNIRTMLSNRRRPDREDYDENVEIYETFLKEYKIWKKKIRDGEETEEHYVAWLKTHYKRKYRNEKTAAET